MGVIFQRPGRPVWVGVRPMSGDLQGALPRFWCTRCGTEVFRTGGELCRKCTKEAYEYATQGKPL